MTLDLTTLQQRAFASRTSHPLLCNQLTNCAGHCADSESGTVRASNSEALERNIVVHDDDLMPHWEEVVLLQELVEPGALGSWPIPHSGSVPLNKKS